MIALGQPRHFLPSTPSTMDVLTELASEVAPEGTIVVAGEQTAGRGRAGRIWSAPPGTSLLMSVLLRPAVSAPEVAVLPLIVGVAVAEAIERVTPNVGIQSVQLKWPNDLFLGGKKLGGILLQSRASSARVDFVNVGIGINVNTPQPSLPETATSLMIETGMTVDLELFEEVVLGQLSLRYAKWIEAGPASGLADWQSRARFLGEQVVIEQDSEAIAGVFTGVSERGGLLLHTGDSTREITVGDLVRGPRPQP